MSHWRQWWMNDYSVISLIKDVYWRRRLKKKCKIKLRLQKALKKNHGRNNSTLFCIWGNAFPVRDIHWVLENKQQTAAHKASQALCRFSRRCAASGKCKLFVGDRVEGCLSVCVTHQRLVQTVTLPWCSQAAGIGFISTAATSAELAAMENRWRFWQLTASIIDHWEEKHCSQEANCPHSTCDEHFSLTFIHLKKKGGATTRTVCCHLPPLRTVASVTASQHTHTQWSVVKCSRHRWGSHCFKTSALRR